jgi:hypothetical protein
MLMGLWRELHPNVPMQFQLTFENNEKKGNSKGYLEEASGKVPPLFGSARCPATQLIGALANLEGMSTTRERNPKVLISTEKREDATEHSLNDLK